MEDLAIRFLPWTHLASRTAKAIYNAWLNATVLDARGTIWVRADKLHTILRTNRPTARMRLQQTPERYQRRAGQKWYVLSSVVLSMLDQTIYEAGTYSRHEYARFSVSLYLEIRDSDFATKKRMVHWERMKTARANLKRFRKRTLNITKDELTGTRLSHRAEFSHIRSVSLYYDIADQYWNGLLVNRQTHERITANHVSDEADLFRLCERQGWRTDWYDSFAQELRLRGLA